MSVWQFAACIDGYNKLQGGGSKQMSDAEFEAASDVYDSFPDRMN